MNDSDKFDMGRAVRTAARAFRPAAYLFIPAVRLWDRMTKAGLQRQMEAVIPVFCTAEQQADRAYMRRLRRDMWYSFILYDAPFKEYFLFGFPRLSHAGRREFVTEYELLTAGTRLAPKEIQAVFANKWSTYLRFQKYYRREVLRPDEHLSPEALAAFIARHPRFIVKSCRGYGGFGVRSMDLTGAAVNAGELLAQFRAQDVMLEEPIVQSQTLARVHPASVNTVRCATFVKDGEPHLLFAHFRTGRGGSIVDNGSSGGFLASVDLETGIVTTPGVTETLYTAVVHPDTGQQILGLRIPRWEEMKSLARELAMVCPRQPYVGWDLALTDDGWVMVEGNHLCGFNGPQRTTQRGLRPLLSQYFEL